MLVYVVSGSDMSGCGGTVAVLTDMNQAIALARKKDREKRNLDHGVEEVELDQILKPEQMWKHIPIRPSGMGRFHPQYLKGDIE